MSYFLIYFWIIFLVDGWIGPYELQLWPALEQHLQQVFAVQVPLLDAVVPGSAEQDVALDHQRLDAVVVRRLKVVSGADAAQRALGHVEQLQQPPEDRDQRSEQLVTVWG